MRTVIEFKFIAKDKEIDLITNVGENSSISDDVLKLIGDTYPLSGFYDVCDDKGNPFTISVNMTREMLKSKGLYEGSDMQELDEVRLELQGTVKAMSNEDRADLDRVLKIGKECKTVEEFKEKATRDPKQTNTIAEQMKKVEKENEVLHVAKWLGKSLYNNVACLGIATLGAPIALVGELVKGNGAGDKILNSLSENLLIKND